VPFIVAAFLHVELHESAGFLLGFPRRGCFACAQAHDCIAHAQCFAGLHFKLSGDAVAFVEQAQHGFALRHRRAGQFCAGAGERLIAGAFLAIGRGSIVAIGRAGATARDEKQQAERKQPPARRRGPAMSHASGVHAS